MNKFLDECKKEWLQGCFTVKISYAEFVLEKVKELIRSKQCITIRASHTTQNDSEYINRDELLKKLEGK